MQTRTVIDMKQNQTDNGKNLLSRYKLVCILRRSVPKYDRSSFFLFLSCLAVSRFGNFFDQQVVI